MVVLPLLARSCCRDLLEAQNVDHMHCFSDTAPQYCGCEKESGSRFRTDFICCLSAYFSLASSHEGHASVLTGFRTGEGPLSSASRLSADGRWASAGCWIVDEVPLVAVLFAGGAEEEEATELF